MILFLLIGKIMVDIMHLSEKDAFNHVKKLEKEYRSIDNMDATKIDELGRFCGFDDEILAKNEVSKQEIKNQYFDFISLYFKLNLYPENIKKIIFNMAEPQNEFVPNIFEDHFWNMNNIIPELRTIIEWAGKNK